jgi:hypothetical protein
LLLPEFEPIVKPMTRPVVVAAAAVVVVVAIVVIVLSVSLITHHSTLENNVVLCNGSGRVAFLSV